MTSILRLTNSEQANEAGELRRVEMPESSRTCTFFESRFICNTIHDIELARVTPRYGCSMSHEPEEQEEKSHEGMSQDEARHEEDVKHHPHGEDAEKDE